MNVQTMGRLIQKGRNAVVKHCPKLLAAAAIAGTVTTAVMAVRETPKALELLEAKKKQLDRPVLTKKETIQTVWKCYIPSAASGLLTVTAIVAGNSIWAQRNTELAIAYSLGQSAMRLYSQKVASEVGITKAIQIHEEVQTTQQLPVQGKLIPLDSYSNDPKDKVEEYYEYYSGNTFHASRNQIEAAIDEFNSTYILGNDGRGSLNQLYSCFHNDAELPQIGSGDLLGWKYDEKFCEGVVPMVTPEMNKYGNLRAVLDYFNPPKYDF